jgi:hypothetical protein
MNPVFTYKLSNGTLVEAPDPLPPHNTDYELALIDAGYTKQVSSAIDGGVGAEISIYENSSGSPRFLVDISGAGSQLACLVADDFPGLMAVLKEVQPLIALVGLDQRSDIRISEKLERK